MSQAPLGALRRPAAALRAAILLVMLAVTAAACGSPSSDPAAYIPDEIDGKEVDREGKFAEQITKSLSTEKTESVVSGTVGGGGEGAEALPDLVLVAAESKTDDAAAIPEQLEKSAVKAEDTEIDGTKVRIFDAGADADTKISFALASPAERIVLISFAFKGGRDAARDGMAAMLEAGG